MKELVVVTRKFNSWTAILAFEDTISGYYKEYDISYRLDVSYLPYYDLYKVAVVIDV